MTQTAGRAPVYPASDHALAALRRATFAEHEYLDVLVEPQRRTGGLHLLRVAQTAPWWEHGCTHVLLRPCGRHLHDRWRSVWAIQLVSDLGMQIIAEGVETSEQEATLLALGYDWVQGFRYGGPIANPPRSGHFTVVDQPPSGW